MSEQENTPVHQEMELLTGPSHMKLNTTATSSSPFSRLPLKQSTMKTVLWTIVVTATCIIVASRFVVWTCNTSNSTPATLATTTSNDNTPSAEDRLRGLELEIEQVRSTHQRALEQKDAVIARQKMLLASWNASGSAPASASVPLLPDARGQTTKPLPVVGFGTCACASSNERIHPNWPAHYATEVTWALEAGYRYFDTATMYAAGDAEAAVGESVREWIGADPESRTREQLVIATKVLPEDTLSYDQTYNAAKRSIERIGLGYVDVLMLHWPKEEQINLEAWRALEQLVSEQHARALGVSNFLPCHLLPLMNSSLVRIPPVLVQLEIHPYTTQHAAVEWSLAKGLVVVSASPFSMGKVLDKLLDDPILVQVATKHDRSVPEIILTWISQRGVVPIPNSASQAHIHQNIDIFTSRKIQLSHEEMLAISSLDADLHVYGGVHDIPCPGASALVEPLNPFFIG